MALVSRLSRLFQADFHAVLDRIEEPELQLRQAVREMQFALEEDRQRLKLIRHEIEQHDKAVAAIVAGLSGYDEELDICLAANEDDLARDLIRRRLGAEKQRHALESRRDSLAAQARELEQQIDEQAQQLDAMMQKLELLAGDDGRGGASVSAESVRSEEVEIALLRAKERRVKA